jgi:hypothetical protein
VGPEYPGRACGPSISDNYLMSFELAGPVEFSTGDIIILVLAGALMLSALPLIGAAIAYVIY